MLAAEIFSGVRAYFLLLPDDAMPEYAAGELAVLYCRAERVGWKTAAGSSVNLGAISASAPASCWQVRSSISRMTAASCCA